MSDVKIYPAREINNFSVSVYSNKPEMHAYEHPDMVSVKVSDLFPGMPEAIYSQRRRSEAHGGLYQRSPEEH